MQLRTRLILAFVAATVVPLAATVWVTTTLLERSLGYATTGELDRLSRTLETTARQFYQRERSLLEDDVRANRVPSANYDRASASDWPDQVRAFWDSGEAERFGLTGTGGDHLELMQKTGDGVRVFSRDLHGIRMEELSAEFRKTRGVIESIEARDLRRGFTLTLLLLLGLVWIVALAPLVFIAHRVSQPIRELTAGLTDFAAGDWHRRVEVTRGDEVGKAIAAFNHMAEQLRQNRERLVQLTQMQSWQSLARKTAHELKNSLTPIRLTVEEMLARQAPADRVFMEQAAQIVVGEIDSLERRVRAFSDFSTEPPVRLEPLDLNALVRERIALLRPAHPKTEFRVTLADSTLTIVASADLVKGILTNLLQNAAEAAGSDGVVLTVTTMKGDHAVIEVHDSGPGVSDEVAATLFEPTITFKERGMGLGLSIAKKNALRLHGDVALLPGSLGGAAFRVTLPIEPDDRT
jgi:nitrogen fixation/metabolism regulation signal transduction histidine kinase